MARFPAFLTIGTPMLFAIAFCIALGRGFRGFMTLLFALFPYRSTISPIVVTSQILIP